MTLFSETSFTVRAFEFTASLAPSLRGETVIVFPPLGRLRAVTHWAPFLLEITLKNVDLGLLSASLKELSASPALTLLQEELRGKASYFLIRLAVISFSSGALTTFLLSKRRRLLRALRRALLGGLTCLLLLVLLCGATLIYPYDAGAFAAPSYEGGLAAAPWIIGLAERGCEIVTSLGEQFEVMALNLEDISSRLDQIDPPARSDEIRVLHVSDIHNNPAAFDLIEKVTDSFQIDLIIDTGDLTDYGSELEAELITRLAGLQQPYLFVPGNHDSAGSIDLLRREGAIILGPVPIHVAGLQIAGLADPAAANSSAEVATMGLLHQESLAVRRLLAESDPPPDIFALHNPVMAGPLLGAVPLVLCGHTHSAGIDFDEESGTIVANAGTTGAAGVRGLLAPHKTPYSAIILYFNPDVHGALRLTAADLISIEQLQDSFTLQRFYNRLEPR